VRRLSAVVKRIDGLTRLLADFPRIGHLADETGVRVISVVRYPFLIFYAIDTTEDEVVILHVRHTAQERP
jgi:toxin ParE1/3/4